MYHTISEYQICERNQPNLRLADSETCEATIFKRYSENKCKTSPFALHKETFILVQNGYIIVSTSEVRLDISCDKGIEQQNIKQSSLLTGSNCKIYNGMDTMYLKSNLKGHFNEEFNRTYPINYSHDVLKSLEKKLIHVPKIINNNELQQAKLSLDDAENILNSIATDRRIRTWKETATDWLSYLGCIALGLGTIYNLYKIGVFELIPKCIPIKLCLFCVKTKVTTPTTVVTYNPSLLPVICHRNT